MKWFLILALIVLIMLIAISVSEQYKDKYDFYNNLKSFLNQLKLNISFKSDKLNRFLQQIKPKKHFKTFILEYQKYLATNKFNLSNLDLLEEEEKVELSNIVTNIGKLDKANEIKQIDLFLLSVEAKLALAYENKTKLCPMIIKLSLLFALALAVLLI